MIDTIIKLLETFNKFISLNLKGVIEIDKIKLYLNPKAIKKVTSFKFFIINSLLLCLLSYIIYTIFNQFSLPNIIKNIVCGFSYLTFIAIAMAEYGSETGDFIEETKYQNTTLQCSHKNALGGLFSKWFLKNGICLIIQIIFHFLFIYTKIQNINFIIVFAITIIIEFTCYAIPYMSITKNDYIEIGTDSDVIFYLDNICRKISLKNTTITIMPNNDILLRDKKDFSYTSKMEIIKANDIKHIKIENLILKLKNNQWQIDY